MAKIKIPKNMLKELQKASVQSYLEVEQEEAQQEQEVLQSLQDKVIGDTINNVYTAVASNKAKGAFLAGIAGTLFFVAIGSVFTNTNVFLPFYVGAAVTAAVATVKYYSHTIYPSSNFINLLRHESKRPLKDYYPVPESYKPGVKVKRLNFDAPGIKVGKVYTIESVDRLYNKIVLKGTHHNCEYQNLEIIKKK